MRAATIGDGSLLAKCRFGSSFLFLFISLSSSCHPFWQGCCFSTCSCLAWFSISIFCTRTTCQQDCLPLRILTYSIFGLTNLTPRYPVSLWAFGWRVSTKVKAHQIASVITLLYSSVSPPLHFLASWAPGHSAQTRIHRPGHGWKAHFPLLWCGPLSVQASFASSGFYGKTRLHLWKGSFHIDSGPSWRG